PDVKAPTGFDAKWLEAVLDDEPLLSEHLLALAEWIAGYYLAPLGEVLRSMLPLMAEVQKTVYYRITDLGRDVLASSVDGEDNHRLGKERRIEGAPGLDEHDIKRKVLERLSGGEPVKVSTVRTSTSASLQTLTAMVRKKWIVRETAAAE